MTASIVRGAGVQADCGQAPHIPVAYLIACTERECAS